MSELAKHCVIDVVPTGLFAQRGRTMNESFAQHAWSNDMRINQMTGQLFTEAYRDNTNIIAISEVLRQLGLDKVVALITDAKTLELANQTVQQGQLMMSKHHIQGVPNMIVHTERGEQVLPSGLLYDIDKCLSYLQTI